MDPTRGVGLIEAHSYAVGGVNSPTGYGSTQSSVRPDDDFVFRDTPGFGLHRNDHPQHDNKTYEQVDKISTFHFYLRFQLELLC
jgi:hypothetical protein